MSLAVTQKGGLRNINRAGRHVWFQVTIVPSGTYPTGGDTLDLRGFGAGGNSVPLDVKIDGQSGATYKYVPGTNRGNGKMMVFVEQTVATNALLGEHTNVTYVAGVSGDTIVATVRVELNAAA